MNPITVTMIGAPGSGKTTYLYAMFTELARGVDAYGIYDRDRDSELELLEGWRALAEEGEVPEATDENPRFHEFVVQHGEYTAAVLSWSDFRGGALFSRSDQHADVVRLQERLLVSDSIHLVLDGAKLAGDPAAASPRLRAELGVERMSTFVRSAVEARVQQRLPLPSVVVLITKADRIVNAANDEGVPHERRMGEVVESVIDLLPVLRRSGLTTMVCPVQVGWFGAAQGRVDPSRVDTQRLHQPILFTVRHRYVVERYQQEAALAELDAAISSDRAELSALDGRLFGGRRRRELRDALVDAERQRSAAAHAGDTAEYWTSILTPSIDTDVPIFQQGRRVNGGGSG
ncbi:MAG: hypothetical protein AB7J32_01070 [Pseudonocardia sp.]